MIKKIIRIFIKIIQGVLLVVSLTIVYFLGFGITLIFMLIFNRRALKGSGKNDFSFWIQAMGYEADYENSLRQS